MGGTDTAILVEQELSGFSPYLEGGENGEKEITLDWLSGWPAATSVLPCSGFLEVHFDLHMDPRNCSMCQSEYTSEKPKGALQSPNGVITSMRGVHRGGSGPPRPFLKPAAPSGKGKSLLVPRM